MASALRLMKEGAIHGLFSGGIAFGTGAGLGYVLHRYPNSKAAQHGPRIATAIGKLGSVLAHGHFPLLGAVSNGVGDAGLALWGCELGLAKARKDSGVRVVAKPLSSALAPGEREITRVGELPPAQDGVAMSWQQVREMATSV